jgi:hypothetical protein
LFYEHAGILLNLGESLSPVLIAKVQHGAPHPQNVLEKFANPGDELEEDFGPDLVSSFDSEEEDLPEKGAWMGDIEWVAFEVLQEYSDEEEDEEEDSEESDTTGLLQGMSALKLDSSAVPTHSPPQIDQHSSLSLLEYLLRLAALQTFEQQSHINLTDEHIVLFLRDDNPASRTQSATLDTERTLRRQTSQTSISSDFSNRLPTPHLPISPPQSEDKNQTTPSAGAGPPPSSPTPHSPVNRNPRTYLERAMAADYGPMTLVTPLAKTRRLTTRNNNNHQQHRRKSPALPPPVKRGNPAVGNPKRQGRVSSAPTFQFSAPKIGKNSEVDGHDTDNTNSAKGGLLASPVLVRKQGSLPQRRVVSLRQK